MSASKLPLDLFPITVEPLYKHTIGNRICMLIREVCLCRGTVLAQLKNWDPNLNAYRSGMLM
jgi:hypothetical protein